VHPCLVPGNSLLANIRDEFNAVEIVGSGTGPQVYTGRGAGALPTASAVVSDVVDQAERRLAGHPAVSRHLVDAPAARLVEHGDIRASFYCRFTVDDAPGVLAEIARIFATSGISIARVIQRGRSETEGGAVPLIMTTHEAPGSAMRTAVDRIGSLPVVRGRPRVIRIADL
jgi:homoserine dehydrogenase